MSTAARLFISYSHKDEPYKDQLSIRLKPYIRNGLIESWDDRAIIPSQEWDEEILNNMNKANVILFLVSPDFIASDYIHDVELKKSMERYEQGTVKIIPIIIRPCDMSLLNITKFQALPKNAKPISTWEDEDEAWMDVITGLRKLFAQNNQKTQVSNDTTQNGPSNAQTPVPPVQEPIVSTELNEEPIASTESEEGFSNQKKEEIRTLIAQAKIKEALALLTSLSGQLDADTNNSVVMLSAQFNRLTKDIRMNIISSEDAQLRNSKLAYGLLGLLD